MYKDGSKSEDIYKYRVRDYSYWYNYDTNDWEYRMFMNYEGDNTINVLDDVMAFDMESIQKMSKQIFNEELKIEKHSYEMDGFALVYNEDGYYWLPRGGVGTLDHANYNIVKAEKINNNIYIYENYMAVLEDTETVSPTLYTALDKKQKIKPTKELESVWDLTIEEKDGDNYKYILDTKKAKEEYGIILPIYKHTFKQSENGNYYWVSTELTNY